MDAVILTKYNPKTFEGLTFHNAVAAFADGSDSPRDYLERCHATIAEKEPPIKALSAINEDAARAAADPAASSPLRPAAPAASSCWCQRKKEEGAASKSSMSKRARAYRW